MASMQIVAISDTHCQHAKLTIPRCDVLLHAGDIGRRGKEEETMEFLSWFDAQPAKYKFLVPGNHDGFLEKHQIYKYRSVHLLYGQASFQLEEFNNVKVFGVPGVLLPRPSLKGHSAWAFGATDDELHKNWRLMPLDTDILVTHGPPFNVLDKTWSNVHAGSKTLLDRLQQSNVKLHVFGHIHEASGVLESNGTLFVNAAVMGLDGQLWAPPTQITMKL